MVQSLTPDSWQIKPAVKDDQRYNIYIDIDQKATQRDFSIAYTFSEDDPTLEIRCKDERTLIFYLQGGRDVDLEGNVKARVKQLPPQLIIKLPPGVTPVATQSDQHGGTQDPGRETSTLMPDTPTGHAREPGPNALNGAIYSNGSSSATPEGDNSQRRDEAVSDAGAPVSHVLARVSTGDHVANGGHVTNGNYVANGGYVANGAYLAKGGPEASSTDSSGPVMDDPVSYEANSISLRSVTGAPKSDPRECAVDGDGGSVRDGTSTSSNFHDAREQHTPPASTPHTVTPPTATPDSMETPQAMLDEPQEVREVQGEVNGAPSNIQQARDDDAGEDEVTAKENEQVSRKGKRTVEGYAKTKLDMQVAAKPSAELDVKSAVEVKEKLEDETQGSVKGGKGGKGVGTGKAGGKAGAKAGREGAKSYEKGVVADKERAAQEEQHRPKQQASTKPAKKPTPAPEADLPKKSKRVSSAASAVSRPVKVGGDDHLFPQRLIHECQGLVYSPAAEATCVLGEPDGSPDVVPLKSGAQGLRMQHSTASVGSVPASSNEDRTLCWPLCHWRWHKLPGGTAFSVFAVFDGHGGKTCSDFLAKHLNEYLSHMLTHVTPEDVPQEDPVQKHLLDNLPKPEAISATWLQQEALLTILPGVLRATFLTLDHDYKQRHRKSGSTATISVHVGFHVVTASVGDTWAYIDTGKAVTQVSGNDRLDTAPVEVARLEEAGMKVARTASGVDVVGGEGEAGHEDGPLRVWPLGLAMGRSVGDYDAGQHVVAEPHISMVTLPSHGARLLVASDGLWDVSRPQQVAFQIRSTPASGAPSKLILPFIKKHRATDDISLITADLALDPSSDSPPPTLKKPGTEGYAKPEKLHVEWVDPTTTCPEPRAMEGARREVVTALIADAETRAEPSPQLSSFLAAAPDMEHADSLLRDLELRISPNELEELQLQLQAQPPPQHAVSTCSNASALDEAGSDAGWQLPKSAQGARRDGGRGRERERGKDRDERGGRDRERGGTGRGGRGGRFAGGRAPRPDTATPPGTGPKFVIGKRMARPPAGPKPPQEGELPPVEWERGSEAREPHVSLEPPKVAEEVHLVHVGARLEAPSGAVGEYVTPGYVHQQEHARVPPRQDAPHSRRGQRCDREREHTRDRPPRERAHAASGQLQDVLDAHGPHLFYFGEPAAKESEPLHHHPAPTPQGQQPEAKKKRAPRPKRKERQRDSKPPGQVDGGLEQHPLTGEQREFAAAHVAHMEQPDHVGHVAHVEQEHTLAEATPYGQTPDRSQLPTETPHPTWALGGGRVDGVAQGHDDNCAQQYDARYGETTHIDQQPVPAPAADAGWQVPLGFSQPGKLIMDMLQTSAPAQPPSPSDPNPPASDPVPVEQPLLPLARGQGEDDSISQTPLGLAAHEPASASLPFSSMCLPQEGDPAAVPTQGNLGATCEKKRRPQKRGRGRKPHGEAADLADGHVDAHVGPPRGVLPPGQHEYGYQRAGADAYTNECGEGVGRGGGRRRGGGRYRGGGRGRGGYNGPAPYVHPDAQYGGGTEHGTGPSQGGEMGPEGATQYRPRKPRRAPREGPPQGAEVEPMADGEWATFGADFGGVRHEGQYDEVYGGQYRDGGHRGRGARKRRGGGGYPGNQHYAEG